MNADDKEQLDKLKARAFEAAPILRKHGHQDLAANILVNTGFAIGLAHRLEQEHEQLLSYLPKVPTEPYEKRLAKEHADIKRTLHEVNRLFAELQWDGLGKAKADKVHHIRALLMDALKVAP